MTSIDVLTLFPGLFQPFCSEGLIGRAIREQLEELVEMGFDFAVAAFPRFEELDDMKIFVDRVMPRFS